jgi:hypothetical protein
VTNQPTAYGKMMAEKRKQKHKNQREGVRKARATRIANFGLCGAKKLKGGGKCEMPAGWGTTHPGTGRCKWHGGSTPTHVMQAAKQEYRKLLGTPIEMNPFDAIMWCIKIRAGEIQWLSEQMAKLDAKAWVEETLVGKQFHLYARERQAAMQDLTKFSQIAIGLGIAERYVKLAETYGEMIGKLINAIMKDPELDMTAEQLENAPKVIRRHLLAIEGEGQKELAAGGASAS